MFSTFRVHYQSITKYKFGRPPPMGTFYMKHALLKPTFLNKKNFGIELLTAFKKHLPPPPFPPPEYAPARKGNSLEQWRFQGSAQGGGMVRSVWRFFPLYKKYDIYYFLMLFSWRYRGIHIKGSDVVVSAVCVQRDR